MTEPDHPEVPSGPAAAGGALSTAPAPLAVGEAQPQAPPVLSNVQAGAWHACGPHKWPVTSPDSRPPVPCLSPCASTARRHRDGRGGTPGVAPPAWSVRTAARRPRRGAGPGRAAGSAWRRRRRARARRRAHGRRAAAAPGDSQAQRPGGACGEEPGCQAGAQRQAQVRPGPEGCLGGGRAWACPAALHWERPLCSDPCGLTPCCHVCLTPQGPVWRRRRPERPRWRQRGGPPGGGPACGARAAAV